MRVSKVFELFARDQNRIHPNAGSSLLEELDKRLVKYYMQVQCGFFSSINLMCFIIILVTLILLNKVYINECEHLIINKIRKS